MFKINWSYLKLSSFPLFPFFPFRKLFQILFFSFALMSCAGPYKNKEAFDKRISQFNADSGKDLNSPPFEILALDFQTIKEATPQRNLASIDSTPSSILESYQSWSNRKIYFLTLYYQYLYFKNLLPHSLPNLQFCPQFHSGVVDNPSVSLSPNNHKNFFETFYSINWEHIKDQQQAQALFPELSLPVTPESTHPTVFDLVDGQGPATLQTLLPLALGIHSKNTYEELSELCEHGTGKNYFIFENFINYVKENPQFKESLPSMKALLKVPLLANFTLLTSLNSHLPPGRSLSSHQTYHELMEVVFDRLQANWSRTYFKELSKRKRTIIEKN